MLAGQAMASPTLRPREAPPADFAAAQYIDSAGCAFVRRDGGWLPRLDGDSQLICGFPPSLPVAESAQSSPPNPMAEAEAALAQVMAEGLRAGDLTGVDPDPAQMRHAPPLPPTTRPADPVATELAATIAAQPVLGHPVAAARIGAGSDLCSLLGVDASRSATGLRNDPSQGLCPGQALPGLVPIGAGAEAAQGSHKIAGSQPDPAYTADHPPAHQPTAAAPAATPKATTKQAAAKPTPKPANPAPLKAARTASVPAPARPATAGERPEMVMAGRYILIGRYKDEAEADAALRQAYAMGLRTLRSRREATAEGGRLILAGPFTDDTQLHRSLDRLRTGGFPKATLR